MQARKRIRHESFTGKVASEAALYGMKSGKLAADRNPYRRTRDGERLVPRRPRSFAVSKRLQYQGLDDAGRPVWA